MGKENDKDASTKDRRKRMRESGSQTEEEEHHVGFRGSCDASARFDEINAKLDKVLTACGLTKERLSTLIN